MTRALPCPVRVHESPRRARPTEEKVTRVAYGEKTLSANIRSRFVENVNGLTVHILEAGFDDGDRPCVLLLHGFPELAYSWRKVILPIASAGFHVVAPDQRGYGRTTGWDGDYDGDVGSFRMLNLVRDSLGLVSALGYRFVACVVGHDFGSYVAAWCSLIRPDVFRSVVLMSAPFAGPPSIPLGPATTKPVDTIHDDLARLHPPRKHYQWYYSTRAADEDMRKCPQGVHGFLRDYFHHKSADWKHNRPFPLGSWSAPELANLPTYYIMNQDEGMAETVARESPTAAEVERCRWLTDEELRVYSAEFERTGFQGGLQWYRCKTSGQYDAELGVFSGRTIDAPSLFIAGKSDWGTYQRPGDYENMQRNACTRMLGCRLVDGAGHWVQQEQSDQVSELILQFLDDCPGAF